MSTIRVCGGEGVRIRFFSITATIKFVNNGFVLETFLFFVPNWQRIIYEIFDA